MLKNVVSTFTFPPWQPPHFSTIYLDDYDDYVFFSFTEPQSTNEKEAFFMDWIIYKMNNEDLTGQIKSKGNVRMEVSCSRFNQDFGLDFRMLNNDEKRFFYLAYSKIVIIKKIENEEQDNIYSAVLGEFTVELARHKSCGSTYKMPLKYKLLSNEKQPIAITVSAYSETLVRMVGAVLAINPHSVSRREQAEDFQMPASDTGPSNCRLPSSRHSKGVLHQGLDGNDRMGYRLQRSQVRR